MTDGTDRLPDSASDPAMTEEVYRKPYKMRGLGEDGLNIVVTIPPLVINKEARSRGLTPKQFIDQFRAIATFNGFEGVRYHFEPIPDKTNGNPTKE